MRPIIGITTYVDPASWGVWRDLPAALIPQAYVEAVTLAGGRAILLPPDDQDADVVGILDGLVLSGGADVAPGLYGASPSEKTVTRPDRDAGEMLLLRRALELNTPVLGICRGMQQLVVAAGGRLHQHLPDLLGHERHNPAPGVYGEHEAKFTTGSRVAQLLGEGAVVHCHHHQGIADPGSLLVTAQTDDGLPEAVEDPSRPFVLGVQWHPEVTRDEHLFGALIDAARQ
ncbi:gamma-glutamyl-gamma-aminobutyrate hydrolase family protein [Actinoplanes sp. NPDC051411]|uniref:gamma-glutamyl-gamma-aminobutyrate hydrolase family protein n=1 Tax=Actinoplanes sp. NPDC051411 TaxID=3155522 RepID=UPI003423A004